MVLGLCGFEDERKQVTEEMLTSQQPRNRKGYGQGDWGPVLSMA